MNFDRRGIAIPIVLGAILCLAVWIGSLSWTMSNSRSRFTQVLKLRRAYFMARSGLQHFFLKVKVFQRMHPEAISVLQSSRRDQWPVLSQSFVEDIKIPSEGETGYHYEISSFTISSQDIERSEMAIEILARGNFEGFPDTIKRVYRVSR